MDRESLIRERASIQDAIDKILIGGQEYQLEGMRMRRPGISVLYSRLEEIDRIINEMDNGGGFEMAVFLGR